MSFITINKKKQTATVHGWDQPDGDVIKHQAGVLVLKIPGYMVWMGRFNGHEYMPTQFHVYEEHATLEEDEKTIKIRATKIVDFETRKPKKENECSTQSS